MESILLPHQTIRAATTVTHAGYKRRERIQESSAYGGKHTIKPEASLAARPKSRTRAFQGSTRQQDKVASPPYNNKDERRSNYAYSIKNVRKDTSTSFFVKKQSSESTSADAPQQIQEKGHKCLEDSQTTASIERDTQYVLDREQAAEEEAQRRDELSTAQDRLREFFSKAKQSSSALASPKVTSASIPEAESPTPEDEAYAAIEGTRSRSEIERNQETVASVSDTSLTSPKFTRPTLAQLQSVELDQFAGLYQSQTAWNPNQDIVLMQDGPERKSLVREGLMQGGRQYIVVILDGDNLLFDPRLLNKGYEGGKFFCEELRQRIAKKHRLIPQKLDLRIRFFSSQNALASVLYQKRVVRKELLFDFLQALTDANLNNYVVNVGRGFQAADLRVKAALVDAILDPGCFRAYLGGLDDFGYKEDLNAIHEMGLLESRVHLIQVPGYAVESKVYKRYAHRAIDLDYLFKNQETALRSMENYNREAFDTVDEVTKTTTSTPCVFYHLTEKGCLQGDMCTYSHEPISTAHKEGIRFRLKHRKCPTLSRGEECHFGDDCLFAH